MSLPLKFLTVAALLWFAAPSCAASWIENDYAFGSNGLKRESLAFSSNISTALVAGANVSFYKDRGGYRDFVYSFRFPLMYSGKNFFISLKPFFYPSGAKIRSNARGARLYLLWPAGEDADESYLHLIFSAAAARQQTRLNLSGGPVKKSFSEASFELQAEKSFYNQFFFMASASGFSKPGKASNSNLINPALDHGEMANLGAFAPVTALPEWAASLQIARSMEPSYNSHIYAGYSKIFFRRAGEAGSLAAGLRLRLNEKASFDFGYNFYKMSGAGGRNYYKLLVQAFF